VPEIVESTNISHKWQFALLEFADTHYAAICMEKDTGFEGEANLYDIFSVCQ